MDKHKAIFMGNIYRKKYDFGTFIRIDDKDLDNRWFYDEPKFHWYKELLNRDTFLNKEIEHSP